MIGRRRWTKDSISIRYDIDADTGCWNWNRRIDDNGYGKITVCSKERQAYHFVYELHNGALGRESYLDHKCANRQCVNPDHLRICTHKQNVQYRSKTTAPRSSRFKGVHRKGKYWAATIKPDYKLIWLGQYGTEIEAASAYNFAAKKHFGEYALLNILQD